MNGNYTKTLAILMLFIAGFSYGQSTTNQESERFLFAQGMFSIDDVQTLVDTETDLRNHPNVQVARLDKYSNRFFILIKNVDELTEDQLRSWFGLQGDHISCIQIGVHGIDQVNPFPFTNCSN